MPSETIRKLSKEELDDLIRTAQKGCRESMWRVVVAHRHLIKDATIRWSFVNCDPSTKYHGAVMGLAAAVMKYDFSTKFETYAKTCAYRRVQRDISQDCVVRVPWNKFFKMLNGQRIKMVEIDSDENADTISAMYDRDHHCANEEKEIIEKEISLLPIREKEAIEMEHGFSDESKKEICERFGCTRQRIEQLVKKGHERLQKKLITKGIKCIV